MTDTSAFAYRSLREKLKAIRDGGHPGAPWARNIIQCLDGLKAGPDNPDLLRALQKCVAMLESNGAGTGVHQELGPLPDAKTIASIFGLGDAQR